MFQMKNDQSLEMNLWDSWCMNLTSAHSCSPVGGGLYIDFNLTGHFYALILTAYL